MVLVIFVGIALGRKFVEREVAVSLPSGWKTVGKALPQQLVNLTFVLNINDPRGLEALFWDVSNPESPNYANYLALDEIVQRFSTPSENAEKVMEWLKSNGAQATITTPTRDFIKVQLPVRTAEDMLKVSFSDYEHYQFGRVTRTLDPYSLPREIAQFVSFVSGVSKFPSRGKVLPIVTKKRYLQQGAEVTPQVIWSSFNTGGLVGSAPSNLQGVSQFLQQYYDPTDLSDFQQNFNLKDQPVAKIIGPNDVNNAGTEALLDIEYVMATAPNVPTWFWSTAGENQGQEPFVQWAQDMNAASLLPNVMSVSYGDEESSISKDYADRLNIELLKLGVRGITVLFSSGDNGVGCTGNCVNDPNWPASSPYVTTVGGFYDPAQLIGDSISSGGFSNYYGTAPYQAAAVQAYLSQGSLPPQAQYNTSGRAMPDVSSFSENVVIFQGGAESTVGGTSCASPVFAGIISLINDKLLGQGLKAVGFLNTALYKIGATNPTAFVDITSGNNGNGCCQGFTATKGWDPVTGWGGPNFPVLAQAFQAFQSKK
uniref:Peptidase S53 domain-containing protein n=1 Tax=Arcella intermedia TaxID=1963864 RepID=A0A6B2L177_9EUKA